MSRSVIANIESGRKTDVTVDQLLALAWVLDVPPVALALPLREPFKHVEIVRTDDASERLTALQLVDWFLERPLVGWLPKRANPGRALSTAILERLRAYSTANAEMQAMEDPERAARVAALLAEIEVELANLGVDVQHYGPLD